VNQLLAVALDGIVEHLRLDGLNAYRQQDRAYIGVGEASIVGELNIHNVHDGQNTGTGQVHIVDLWLGVRLRDDSVALFFDSATGIETTAEKAAIQAGLNWLHGVLSPILPLLGFDGGQFEVFGAGDELDFEYWDLYCGPLQITGSNIEQLADSIRKNHPLKGLKGLIASRFEDRQLHWAKVFRVRDVGLKQDLADCFLDSQHDVEAGKELLNWPWPSLNGRHSFRQFVVLVPRDTT
jgi:hypothetical protein